jgi:hypothetical protein
MVRRYNTPFNYYRNPVLTCTTARVARNICTFKVNESAIVQMHHDGDNGWLVVLLYNAVELWNAQYRYRCSLTQVRTSLTAAAAAAAAAVALAAAIDSAAGSSMASASCGFRHFNQRVAAIPPHTGSRLCQRQSNFGGNIARRKPGSSEPC